MSHICTAGLHINFESSSSLPYAILLREYWCDNRKESNSGSNPVIIYKCCSQLLSEYHTFFLPFNSEEKINGEWSDRKKKKTLEGKALDKEIAHRFHKRQGALWYPALSGGWHPSQVLCAQGCLVWIHYIKMAVVRAVDCLCSTKFWTLKP